MDRNRQKLTETDLGATEEDLNKKCMRWHNKQYSKDILTYRLYWPRGRLSENIVNIALVEELTK